MTARASIRLRRGAPVIAGAGLLLAGCADAPPAAATRWGADSAQFRRMLVAEDTRGRGPEALSPLFEGVRSPNPLVRQWAVRALGRLEDPAVVPEIAPLLADSVAAVRAQAADAMAQAVHRGEGRPARTYLLRHIDVEPLPHVRALLAESLGRIRHENDQDVLTSIQLLLRLTRDTAGGTSQPELLLGALRGLYFLVRQPVARAAGYPPELGNRLDTLAHFRTAPTTDLPAAQVVQRIRGIAVATMGIVGAATEPRLTALLTDPSPFVRREAAVAGATLPDSAAMRRIAEIAVNDTAATVRYEGFRLLGRVPRAEGDCALFRTASADTRHPHVALQVLALLGERCRDRPAAITLLDSVAAALPAAGSNVAASPPSAHGWHGPAHALVALAGADPRRAAARLPAFVTHADPFVRMYAARGAARLRDRPVLETLARDPHPNVRVEAVLGLAASAGHAADAIYIAQLSNDDGQLLKVAAEALEGTRDTAALPALLSALERVSAARRETSRDARGALLTRIGALGEPTTAARVEAYTRDFDRAIAEQAADLVQRWTGQRPRVEPAPLPAPPLPTAAELEAFDTTRATILMETGDTIQLRLLPFIAPTNVARFVRLARAGYFDGLTIHRVVPNFVVQGGSPAANEYAGDGPFTRDELGVASNWRGTVGLSTRGRDTGDGQLYINLVDNIRLDHDYTVWAEVVSGMDAVDRILEGAVMARVTAGAAAQTPRQ